MTEEYNALGRAMDLLAAKYAETHDPKIREEIDLLTSRCVELKQIIDSD
jgi:hypothetical protein